MNGIQSKIDNFCVDCQRWTRQTYRHTNHVDGDLVYVCEDCGCENSVFPLTEKEFDEAMDKAAKIVKS